MARQRTYKSTHKRYNKHGGSHTRFAGAPVAKRKYIKSGKYKGVHRRRGFGHLRHMTL